MERGTSFWQMFFSVLLIHGTSAVPNYLCIGVISLVCIVIIIIKEVFGLFQEEFGMHDFVSIPAKHSWTRETSLLVAVLKMWNFVWVFILNDDYHEAVFSLLVIS